MQPTPFNDFVVATDSRVGPWSGTPSHNQIENANIIRSFFLNEGWTLQAICGMLGCMQGESTINPAFIQETNRFRLPNNAQNLSDVPNEVMQNFYKEFYQVKKRAFAIGLIQWDGYSPRNGQNRQKLVGYCEDNNMVWYDGWAQLYRIRGEWIYDVTNHTDTFFQQVRVSGDTYDYLTYPWSTASPDILATAWTWGVEKNEGGVGYRGQNALTFYDIFTSPDAPPILPPEQFREPVQWNPDVPPFDPDDPTPVNPDGIDMEPVWFVYLISKRRKEGKRPCRTI